MARHCACLELPDAASISSAAAPSLRRMSAASLAAPMISLVFSIMAAARMVGEGPPPDPAVPVGGWDAWARIAAKSSGGWAPPIWAATVDPADVPMIRSAWVTSVPTSNRPAMTPISHALPAALPNLPVLNQERWPASRAARRACGAGAPVPARPSASR